MNPLEKIDYQLPSHLKTDIDATRDLIKKAKSNNTRRAYNSDWRQFAKWCSEKGLPALPTDPAVVCVYIKNLMVAGKKPATVQRALTAISRRHEEKGINSPTKHVSVRDAMKGFKNTIGTRQVQKKAASTSILYALIDHLPDTAKGLRDKTILLIGFAGALRRSEITALNVEDIEFISDGMTINIAKSKTDQTGEGRLIGIKYGKHPYCPVRTIQQWLKTTGIKTGAIFRSMTKGGQIKDKRLPDRNIADIIKDAAENAGFDRSEFSGHSLRRGFITTAKRVGTDEHNIMRHTRHKSIATMRRYIDSSDVMQDNPTAHIWDEV